MNIAIRTQIPTLESELIADIFRTFGEVSALDQWDISSHTRTYDLVACIGPVTSCPLAKKRMLFAFGPMILHQDFDWDMVITTSKRASMNARTQFKKGPKIFCLSPPLLCLEAGRRRLMQNARLPLRVSTSSSPIISDGLIQMISWNFEKGFQLFTALEFNSLCRNGAYGMYLGMEDGFDIQVRRHLVFGSPVCCPLDREVIGDLADVCSDSPRLLDVQPIEDNIGMDYPELIKEALEGI